MTGRARSGGGAGGFTLLETLVALAILGVVMSTVYALFGNGLRAASRDEDRLLLGLVAQNLLVRSRLDLDPGSGGTLSGDIDGGLRWRIESEPYVLPKDILPDAPEAADERLLAPREDQGESSRADGTGFGAQSAMERESEGARDRVGADAAEGRGPGSDETETPAQREPLRLRRVVVVVEKGSQQFELSSLALEPPRDDRAR